MPFPTPLLTGKLSLIPILLSFPFLTAAAPVVGPDAHPSQESPDSVAVITVVEAFHKALADGDGSGAMALLAQEAVVAESGGLETRAEYESHHLPGDMAFASSVTRRSTLVQLKLSGSTAWMTSTTETRGDYRGNPIDSQGVELMVLSKERSGWRIAAIHWSSRRTR
jgi:ketosteroid isomerase-like protein